MADQSAPTAHRGTTDSAGRSTDDGQGRTFPCEECGADLVFHIGHLSLVCPFCSHEQALVFDGEAEVEEQDLKAVIKRLQTQRQATSSAPAGGEARCDACGATVMFTGTLTSTECAYCASPIQLEGAHSATGNRVPVDGVLPFQVEKESATSRLGSWVKSRWFAPNDFKRRGVQGAFNGVYLPYWTFDAMTFTHYSGWRGVDRTVTRTDSKGNTTTTIETDWYRESGRFQRFFDDVLVSATTGLPARLLKNLEPWSLERCVPFTQQALAGLQARTYEVELEQGFQQGRSRIDDSLERDVRARIGGNRQRVDSIRTRYDALTFKHLLLPLWLLAYRYRQKVYQVLVNAQTGEVQGQRPYSWIKIACAVVPVVVIAGVLAYFEFFT